MSSMENEVPHIWGETEEGYQARVLAHLRNRSAPTPEVREPAEQLDTLASRVLAMCKLRGWSLHWTHRGAYLHLESSELIEAVRGKRGDILGEAADVLLVLMSITENQGIPFSRVVEQATATTEALETKPHYAGEEFTTSPSSDAEFSKDK